MSIRNTTSQAAFMQALNIGSEIMILPCSALPQSGKSNTFIKASERFCPNQRDVHLQMYPNIPTHAAQAHAHIQVSANISCCLTVDAAEETSKATNGRCAPTNKCCTEAPTEPNRQTHPAQAVEGVQALFLARDWLSTKEDKTLRKE